MITASGGGYIKLRITWRSEGVEQEAGREAKERKHGANRWRCK
jgi:hypothetical protein